MRSDPKHPKKTPKSPVLGDFHDFSTFWDPKRPHFGSRTDPCWVKWNWCPLKYFFTSSYHDYRTHPWSHQVKYTKFVKIGFEVDFHKMGVYNNVFGKLTWFVVFFRRKRCFMVSCTRSYTHGTPHYVAKQPEFGFIFSRFCGICGYFSKKLLYFSKKLLYFSSTSRHGCKKTKDNPFIHCFTSV